MKLFTPTNFFNEKVSIFPSDKMLSIGSCFSERIGTRLQKSGFSILVNPVGTLFNPLSISKILRRGLNNDVATLEDIQQNQERYFHFDASGQLADTEEEKVLANFNCAIKDINTHVRSSKFIIITLGTAFAYQLNSTKEVVANCHKVPQANFTKVLLSIDQMTNRLSSIINDIKEVNPEVKFIFTVSPVRHIKDGVMENQRSKARLIEVVHSLRENQGTFYFPSYEIVMDELRDYRFYNQDLVHPNSMAEEIIWEYFSKEYFSNEAKEMAVEVEKLNKSLSHKPFNVKSNSYRKFLDKQEEKIDELQGKYPHIDFASVLLRLKSLN